MVQDARDENMLQIKSYSLICGESTWEWNKRAHYWATGDNITKRGGNVKDNFSVCIVIFFKL